MKKPPFRKFLSALLATACALSGLTLTTAVGAKTTTDTSAGTTATTATTTETTTTNDPSSFSWDNASVYFLLTDRFKNGNTSNDHSYNRGLDQDGSVVTDIDDRATFHGGDFAGITQTINDGYFDDLGINALWISAPYEQIHGYVVGDNSNPSFAHYSYHGYYVLDYTQTDANFGTAQEFETLVDTAHKHGIRVVIDIVMNHAGYNSIYDMNEYGFGDLKTGWEDDYYSYTKVSNELYHSYIDYDGSSSLWANWWGADWIRCGVSGYTEGGGDNYTMSLSGLPDFKTESTKTVSIPKLLQTKWNKEGRYNTETSKLNSYLSKTGKSMTVTNTLSYWLSSWVRDYGVDGFRCDTAKHVELSSWKTLKETCVEALKEWRENNPDKPGADWTDDFWMTGECWDHGMYKDDYYTSGGFDSMINFNTQGGGLVAQSTVAGVYQSYADTINNDPTFNVLSYMSSHDSVLARDDMINRGSAFLLLPGAVQIFYGDESNRPLADNISFDGNGGAGHSLRSDMNWDSMDTTQLEHWQTVGTFRKNHIAVGGGDNTNVTSSAGVAFTRTYNKNGISDKVACCIYAGSNNDVTIDVSNIWEDGHDVMNAYDGSSDTVKDGKVTFNSGNNGTILIQEPDGKPIVSFKGNSKFAGSQVLTVTLKETSSATVSIDGGHKFIVKDGDQFEIGKNAYDGDKIKLTVSAENDKGTMNKTVTYTKVSKEDLDDNSTTQPEEQVDSIVYVKAPSDGSIPSLYAWTGSSNAINGAWPGTAMEYDQESGYYKTELDTNESYNVIVSQSGNPQSADITDLYGVTYINCNSYSNATLVSTETPSGGTTDTSTTTIRVKMADGSTPTLYVWDDNKKNYNGAWPGSALTEKDEEGYYVFTANASKVNCIVNKGSDQAKTSDITGLSGDVKLDVSESFSVKKTVIETPVSGLSLLKQETREIKEMYSYEYTTASWNTLNALVSPADEIIAKGEDAEDEEINNMITKIQNAKKELVLASPVITTATVGSSTIIGTAVLGSQVTVTANSKTLTTEADEITGIWTVNINSNLTSSSVLTASATKNDLKSGTTTYEMSNGSLSETPIIPQSPVDEYNGTDPNPNTGQTTYLYGDVDLDGEITVKDATVIQKYAIDKVTLNDIQQKASDVNNDGLINVKDATIIQKYLVKQVKAFTAGTAFTA